MFSMDLMSLRREAGCEGVGDGGEISDFTLPGLTLTLGGGEVEWGGDTGGLLSRASLLPPRALKAEARPVEPMEEAREDTGGV